MRIWIGILGIWLASASLAGAQTEEVVLGRKGSEWIAILKTHKETKYRRASLIALELFGGKARGVAPALFEALEKDPEPEVRREAALLLGRMGTEAKGSVKELVETVRRDKSAAVRQAAARALGGKLKEPTKLYAQELAELLSDKDAGVRAALAETFRDLEEDAKPAFPALLKMARDKNEDRFGRLNALQVLSLNGEEHADIVQLLKDIFLDKAEATNLRETALDGLARRENPAHVSVLAAALDEKELKIRQIAAAGFAKLGAKAKEAWPAIQKGLKDADATVRLQLIRATGSMARVQDDAITALGEVATKEQSTENLLAAVQELRDLGSRAQKTVPHLTRLAENDGRALIRQAAEEALKKIQSP